MYNASILLLVLFKILSFLVTPFLAIAFTFHQVNFFEPEWNGISSGDCILILGARVLAGNIPDIMMKERVETAAKFITPNVKTVILTGGTVDKKKPESEVMKELLIEKGIDKKRLILEEEATSTYENLLFSKPLIEKQGCGKLDIVSHRFHLARVALTARRLRISVNRLIPAEENPKAGLGRNEREIKAFLWYLFFWNSLQNP